VPVGRLSPLQERILVVLAGLEPPWTLTGGGALVGFHTKHRETRDLDLFFHQQLTLKLCALLSRSELRDLVDVRALLDAGGDLTRALADCPRQDGGFSPLTFSWAVKNIAVEKLARALGWDDSEIVSIVRYRDELVDQVLAIAQP
jgi:hypothetical protein